MLPTHWLSKFAIYCLVTRHLPATAHTTDTLILRFSFLHNPIASMLAPLCHGIDIWGTIPDVAVAPVHIHLWTTCSTAASVTRSSRTADAQLKLRHARPDDDRLPCPSIGISDRTTAWYETKRLKFSFPAKTTAQQISKTYNDIAIIDTGNPLVWALACACCRLTAEDNGLPVYVTLVLRSQWTAKLNRHRTSRDD